MAAYGAKTVEIAFKASETARAPFRMYSVTTGNDGGHGLWDEDEVVGNVRGRRRREERWRTVCDGRRGFLLDVRLRREAFIVASGIGWVVGQVAKGSGVWGGGLGMRGEL